MFAEISVEPLSDALILVGVTNEKRMILNRARSKERWQVLNLGFREADTTQKMQAGVLIMREDH